MPDATEPLRHELQIAAPPEVVFAYFTDPGCMVEWMGVGALLTLSHHDLPPSARPSHEQGWTTTRSASGARPQAIRPAATRGSPPPDKETGGVARFGFGFGPDWAKTLELRVDALEPGRQVEWTPVGGFPGWVGTTIRWDLEPAEDGGTVVHFEHTGWQDEQADGEMAMCGYTWAMIIDRLSAQAARGERAPYFKATAPLPR